MTTISYMCCHLFLTVPHLELVDPVIYACWFLGKTLPVLSLHSALWLKLGSWLSKCWLVCKNVVEFSVQIVFPLKTISILTGCICLWVFKTLYWTDLVLWKTKNADEGAKESKEEEEAAPAAAGAEEAKPWRSNWVCSTTSVTTHDIQLD